MRWGTYCVRWRVSRSTHISGKRVTVVMLEDEDGMNRCSCLCSTWTGPAGSSTGLTGPVRTPSVMADCVPPLLLEACVLLGASEDKLADIHQVSAPTDRELVRGWPPNCGPVVETSRNKGLLCRAAQTETGCCRFSQ